MRETASQLFLCGSPLQAAERVGLMLAMGCKYCYLGPHNAWESLEAGIFQGIIFGCSCGARKRIQVKLGKLKFGTNFTLITAN